MKRPLKLKGQEGTFRLGYKPSYKDFLRLQKEKREHKMARLHNQDLASRVIEIAILGCPFLFHEGLRDQKNS